MRVVAQHIEVSQVILIDENACFSSRQLRAKYALPPVALLVSPGVFSAAEDFSISNDLFVECAILRKWFERDTNLSFEFGLALSQKCRRCIGF